MDKKVRGEERANERLNARSNGCLLILLSPAVALLHHFFKRLNSSRLIPHDDDDSKKIDLFVFSSHVVCRRHPFGDITCTNVKHIGRVPLHEALPFDSIFWEKKKEKKKIIRSMRRDTYSCEEKKRTGNCRIETIDGE